MSDGITRRRHDSWHARQEETDHREWRGAEAEEREEGRSRSSLLSREISYENTASSGDSAGIAYPSNVRLLNHTDRAVDSTLALQEPRQNRPQNDSCGAGQTSARSQGRAHRSAILVLCPSSSLLVVCSHCVSARGVLCSALLCGCSLRPWHCAFCVMLSLTR